MRKEESKTWGEVGVSIFMEVLKLSEIFFKIITALLVIYLFNLYGGGKHKFLLSCILFFGATYEIYKNKLKKF